jgi:hypothetical protein
LHTFSFIQAYGIVYLVDASDPERIDEAERVLHEIYKDPRLKGKPLLVSVVT